MFEQCQACKRNVYSYNMTIHHWKPKCQGGTNDDTMRICCTCHNALHYLIPIEQVQLYQTPESLENNWLFKKYLGWIRTKTHPNSYKIKKILEKFLDKNLLKLFKNAA